MLANAQGVDEDGQVEQSAAFRTAVSITLATTLQGYLRELFKAEL